MRAFTLVCTAACLAVAACSAPLMREDRFTGTLSGCGPDSPATLVVGPDQFSFAPTDGVLVLTGDIAKDGQFSGSLTTGEAADDKTTGEQKKPGNDQKKTPYVLRVEGRVSGDVASGEYTTPRCHTSFQLTRRPRPILPL